MVHNGKTLPLTALQIKSFRIVYIIYHFITKTGYNFDSVFFPLPRVRLLFFSSNNQYDTRNVFSNIRVAFEVILLRAILRKIILSGVIVSLMISLFKDKSNTADGVVGS